MVKRTEKEPSSSKDGKNDNSCSMSRMAVVVVLIVVNLGSLFQSQHFLGALRHVAEDLDSSMATFSGIIAGEGRRITLLRNKTQAAQVDASIAASTGQLADGDLETALVILTSLIPSHPSLDMLKETMASLPRLKGLSINAPIYIMVDMVPSYAIAKNQGGTPEERVANEERLEAYVHNLYKEYDRAPNIHIVVNAFNKHIGGSTQKALSIFDPRTKFIHVIQHDFRYIIDIDHKAVVKSMKDEPKKFHMIRFNKRRMIGHLAGCKNLTRADINGIHLEPSMTWSDNNHIAPVWFYNDLLTRLDFVQRAPEAPMQNAAMGDCVDWAQWVYGINGQQYAIEHLDGRHRAAAAPVAA